MRSNQPKSKPGQTRLFRSVNAAALNSLQTIDFTVLGWLIHSQDEKGGSAGSCSPSTSNVEIHSHESAKKGPRGCGPAPHLYRKHERFHNGNLGQTLCRSFHLRPPDDRVNKLLRGKDSTTDVFPFPHEPDEFDPDNNLGDIVISVEQAQKQADETGSRSKARSNSLSFTAFSICAATTTKLTKAR